MKKIFLFVLGLCVSCQAFAERLILANSNLWVDVSSNNVLTSPIFPLPLSLSVDDQGKTACDTPIGKLTIECSGDLTTISLQESRLSLVFLKNFNSSSPLFGLNHALEVIKNSEPSLLVWHRLYELDSAYFQFYLQNGRWPNYEEVINLKMVPVDNPVLSEQLKALDSSLSGQVWRVEMVNGYVISYRRTKLPEGK